MAHPTERQPNLHRPSARAARLGALSQRRPTHVLAALVCGLVAGLSRAQSTDLAQQRSLLARHQRRGGSSSSPAVVLGRKLYFDPRLSADGMISCATCHDLTHGLADARPVSVGLGGARGRRNAPTTANVGLLPALFHDGRVTSLEEQAKLPILNPTEMGHASPADAVAAIASDTVYRRMFHEAFGRAPDFDGMARALAAFQRTLVYMDAPFDQWRRGDESAISSSAKRGHALFVGRARCATCHPIDDAPWSGTNGGYANTGIAARRHDLELLLTRAEATPNLPQSVALASDLESLGRFLVTRSRRNVGAFRTAPLRNVGVTAPYMHDGSLRTLWDVIDHYRKGGIAHPFLDARLRPLPLSPRDTRDLVAFLVSLTDVRFSALQAAETARQGLSSVRMAPPPRRRGADPAPTSDETRRSSGRDVKGRE